MTALRPRPPLLDNQAVELVDHVLPGTGNVVLVEYGDYDSSATAHVSTAVRRICDQLDGVVVVYRHFPVDGRPPQAMRAAQAAEAAGAQGCFWSMHDALLAHGGAKTFGSILRVARRCGVPDRGRLLAEVTDGEHLGKIARDIALATDAGVDHVPAFVVDGELYDDPAGPVSLVHEIERRLGSQFV